MRCLQRKHDYYVALLSSYGVFMAANMKTKVRSEQIYDILLDRIICDRLLLNEPEPEKK